MSVEASHTPTRVPWRTTRKGDVQDEIALASAPACTDELSFGCAGHSAVQTSPQGETLTSLLGGLTHCAPNLWPSPTWLIRSQILPCTLPQTGLPGTNSSNVTELRCTPKQEACAHVNALPGSKPNKFFFDSSEVNRCDRWENINLHCKRKLQQRSRFPSKGQHRSHKRARLWLRRLRCEKPPGETCYPDSPSAV